MDEKRKRIALKFTEKHRQHIKAYIREMEIERHKGDRVFCPVCEKSFGSFAPYYPWNDSLEENSTMMLTNGTRPSPERNTSGRDRKCPNCGSLERQRLLWLYLKNKTDIFDEAPKRLLDFAPYLAFFDAFSARKNIAYYPCDLFPDSLNFIDFSGGIIQADITKMGFSDMFFDVILCSHILEHLTDDQMAISELFRLMKSDGWGIIQVPLDTSRLRTFEDPTITTPEEREIAFGQKDHLRVYGRDFKERLEIGGFKVSADQYVESFDQNELVRYGLDPEETLFIVRK